MKVFKLHFLIQNILRLMFIFNNMFIKVSFQLYNVEFVFNFSRNVFRKLFSSWRFANIEIITQFTIDWNACIQTLENHSNSIVNVIFSFDESRITFDSKNNTIRMWNVQIDQCEHTFDDHFERIFNVIFSFDESRITFDSWNNTMRVWNIAISNEILCYDNENFSQNIEFNQNNKSISIDDNLLFISIQISFLNITIDTFEFEKYLSVFKLTIEKDWIILSFERILWFSLEYRDFKWTSYRDTIVIDNDIDRVIFVHYDRTRL